MNHWIVLPVVLPAFLGPLMVLTMRFDLVLQRIFSVVGMLVMLALACALMVMASNGDPQLYKLGNWDAPFGIVLVLDRLSALIVLLTAILALGAVLYSLGSGWDKRGWHLHALFQFQIMGICGAFLTGDAFNLFVFFEVLLIASYGLMIHGGGKLRLQAGVQYIVYNLAGSTMFLFALGTIYSVTGTLNMADIAVKVAQMPASDTALLRVGVVMLLMVFAVKAAIVPVHFWLVATYQHAPGPVAALFAIMTKVGVYAIIRSFNLMFPQGGALGSMAQELILPAAVVMLFVGMIGVLGARDLARMMGFAVIGSVGTMLLAFGQFTAPALSAGLYYMVHSTFAAAALFLLADLIGRRRGADGLSLRATPAVGNGALLGGLFMVGAIAMTGLPPLSGFLGKLMILDALRDAARGMWLWAAILVTSLIAMMGFARAGSLLFWKAYGGDAPAHPVPGDETAPALAFAAVIGLLAILAALTVLAGPISLWLQGAAAQIMDSPAYIGAVLAVKGPGG